MANEFRSESAKSGRVDYTKNTIRRAKQARARTGGSVPGSQPKLMNRAHQQRHAVTGRFHKAGKGSL